jgi:hypothetical protein
MNTSVDVHVLTLPTDNKDWYNKCIDSLRKEPVTVHVCNGIEDDIGNARADAFLLGNNEYASFVDPDDYVLPGGFAACLDVIKAEGSVAACTAEIKTGISGEILEKPYIVKWIHHLIVMKREIVIQNMDIWRDWSWPSRFSEGRVFVEFLRSCGHKVSFIEQPYYVWRRHISSYTIKKQVGPING